MYARCLRYFSSRTPRTRRVMSGSIFLAVAALMSASIFATGPEATPEPRSEKAWPVSLMTVTPSAAKPSLRVYGRVESSRIAHLRTNLVAEVAEVHVREGDWVEAGALLITLNDRELKLRLIEQRAELTRLEAELDSLRIERASMESSTSQHQSMRAVAQNRQKRHEDLMAKRLISQSLLDEVTAQANEVDILYQAHMRMLADFPNRLTALEASIASAGSRVQQADYDIEKSRVLAPFAGPVLGVFVAPGDRSNIGVSLVDVADAGAFEVRVQLPGLYADRLQASLSGSKPVTARSSNGRELRLSRLSGQVRTGQSGLDAFFEFDADPAAALGRLLELMVMLPEENNVIAVPVQSIYENDRIYAVQNNRLQAITIERVGETQTDTGEYRVLVRSAELDGNTAIITTQLPRAIDGLLVEPA